MDSIIKIKLSNCDKFTSNTEHFKSFKNRLKDSELRVEIMILIKKIIFNVFLFLFKDLKISLTTGKIKKINS